MISAEALALAPAVTGLGSWLADIGERLMRGIINADQALAEMRQRQADTDQEIAVALAGVKSDRAAIDAKIDKLPSALTPAAPPPPGPVPRPAAPEPPPAPEASPTPPVPPSQPAPETGAQPTGDE